MRIRLFRRARPRRALSTLAAPLLLLAFLSLPARAQEPPSDTHRAAAEELVDLLKLKEVTAASMDVMMESMISQNPQFKELRSVFEGFFDDYFSWEQLEPQFVTLYADSYTEDELRELIAFYHTPVGQKTVDLAPTLMQEAAEIGQRQIEPHLPELQRRIMKWMGNDG